MCQLRPRPAHEQLDAAALTHWAAYVHEFPEVAQRHIFFVTQRARYEPGQELTACYGRCDLAAISPRLLSPSLPSAAFSQRRATRFAPTFGSAYHRGYSTGGTMVGEEVGFEAAKGAKGAPPADSFAAAAIMNARHVEHDVPDRQIKKGMQVAAVMPTLLGIKYDLVRPDFDSALRPYLGAGGGIYWASDIQVIERDYYDEEVGVDSEARPGAYAGGGIDFLIGEHFLINYDVKYHWVDFDSERFDDGWEFALGFAITWGR